MQATTHSTGVVPESNRSRPFLLGALILAIAVMLIAGLTPYANYKDNWVSFRTGLNETDFGKYGLALGSLPEFVEQAAKSHSLQVVINAVIIKPSDKKFHLFAQIDSPSSKTPLILGQWTTSLIAINGEDRRNDVGLPRVSANLSKNVGLPVELAYTFGASETIVELDGRLKNTGPPFKFSDPLNRIVIGNSRNGKDGWFGKVSRVKFVDLANPNNSIVYRFDQNTLPSIAAETSATTDDSFNLTVPATGKFPDRAWIGSLRFSDLRNNNPIDIIVNFLGFVPFGFLLTAFLVAGKRKVHTAVAYLLAGVVGFLLSFGIESTQTIIPGRSPHMHDLFLNTLGAFAGSIGFLILAGLWKLLRSDNSAPGKAIGDDKVN